MPIPGFMTFPLDTWLPGRLKTICRSMSGAYPGWRCRCQVAYAATGAPRRDSFVESDTGAALILWVTDR